MLGQIGMADGVAELSISHGERMLKHAESSPAEVTAGGPMKSLHEPGPSPEASEDMAYTHCLADSAAAYMTALQKVVEAPGHAH